jgi:hypothetical protein
MTAALISIILSCGIMSQMVLLNPDAICYLQSAEAVSLGLAKVMSLCDQSQWPFYSFLIAGFAKITTLSYEHAAFVLNGLFSLFTVLMFIRIVAFFSDKRNILWLAALVILFAHELNSFKQDIIRDHGFWFFYLSSIFFLLQYFKQKKQLYALCFSISLLFATLFRIEGAIFLLFLPCLAWFDAKQSFGARWNSFLWLNSPVLLIAIILLIANILHPNMPLGRLYELYQRFQPSHFYSSVLEHYTALADGLGNAVLGRSENNRYLIYFFTLVVWYASIVISVLSLGYTILFIYALTKKLLPLDRSTCLVLVGYITINVLVTFIFLVENQFLSKRYIYALALTLMLWVPFSLDYLIKQYQSHKWLVIFVLFSLAMYGVGGLFHFGHSKQYIRDAGDWLNSQIPKAAVIYSNDYQVMYYSHHFGNEIFIKQHEFADLSRLYNGKWKQYDYLAIRLNKKMLTTYATLLNEIKNKPIIVFSRPHDEDEVRIYRRSQQ